MDKQQRELFRVEFPQFYSPSLHLEDGRYDVQDLSECCVRFKVEAKDVFKVTENVFGIIHFPDDDIYDCSGTVVRVSDDDVIIELDKPIPLQKIKSEHLSVLHKSVKA
jgi:hypothetical protein